MTKAKTWASAMLPAIQLWAKHDQFLRKADPNAPVGSFQCSEHDLAVRAKRLVELFGITQCTAGSFSNKASRSKKRKRK